MRRELIPMLKFGAVGAVNTGIDFAVFTLLTVWGWFYFPAQCVSYTCGVLNGYMLNRSWTFRSVGRSGRRAFAKFALLNLVTLLFTTGVIALLHQGTGLPVLLSKLCANGGGVLLNYAGNRLWVFGQQRTIAKE